MSVTNEGIAFIGKLVIAGKNRVIRCGNFTGAKGIASSCAFIASIILVIDVTEYLRFVALPFAIFLAADDEIAIAVQRGGVAAIYRLTVNAAALAQCLNVNDIIFNRQCQFVAITGNANISRLVGVAAVVGRIGVATVVGRIGVTTVVGRIGVATIVRRVGIAAVVGRTGVAAAVGSMLSVFRVFCG